MPTHKKDKQDRNLDKNQAGRKSDDRGSNDQGMSSGSHRSDDSRSSHSGKSSPGKDRVGMSSDSDDSRRGTQSGKDYHGQS